MGLINSAYACTSAIIGADRTAHGRPLLWKHRDTSSIDNKVEYVAPGSEGFGYTGLFNAADSTLRECWTGFNSEGFAIMNTASYNIKDDDVPEKQMDKEGLVMTLALRKCRSVDDFANLLDSLPRPMGVEANFGVIDASGAGAFFETNNHSYVRINLEDSPDHVLVRANYSHKGRPEEGFGYVREANAWRHLRPFVDNANVTPELLTETVSRSFYHDLWEKDMAEGLEPGWAVDQDFIPRYKSCATIVIEGCDPSSVSASDYVMWTGLGYPPCAVIYPVTPGPEGVHPDLRGLRPNGHSKASDEAKARRELVFPRKYDNGDKYIDLSQLRNRQGSGFLQVLVPHNLRIYNDFRARKQKPERKRK
ncbi:MAG: C45 family peptidase [Muribaculum sp.]|nr:C45 family peptidase [Muribaculum sp.]